MAGSTMMRPPSSPEEVLRLLGVASRNLSMYSKEHPAYQRVLKELELALARLLEERKRLSIQMTPQHLLADGRVLPHNPLLHSMATELLRRGIQGFTFARGVSEAELNVLLDILSRRMPEGGELPFYEQELRRASVKHIWIHPVRATPVHPATAADELLQMVVSGRPIEAEGRDALAEYLLRDPEALGKALSVATSSGEASTQKGARRAAEKLVLLVEQLLEGRPEQWETFRERLVQVVLAMELEGQMEFFLQAMAQPGQMPMWARDVARAMPPAELAEILARSFSRGEDADPSGRGQLLRFLLQDQESRDGIMTELDSKLAEYGIPRDEFLEILRQEPLSLTDQAMLFLEGAQMCPETVVRAPELVRELLKQGQRQQAVRIANRFLNGLNHPEWEVRKAVAQSLGALMAAMEAMPQSAKMEQRIREFVLNKALREPDKEVFKLLAEVLQEQALRLVSCGETASALVLLQRLLAAPSMNSMDPAYLASSKEAFRQRFASSPLADELLANVRKATDEEFGNAMLVLRLMGEEAARRLIDMLGEEKSLSARLHLVRALAKLGEDALEPIRKALLDPRWFLVRNLALVLGQMRHPKAVTPLLGLMNHADARVRREALGALGAIGTPKTREAIMRALEDEDEGVRLKAVELLRAARSDTARQRLRSVALGQAGRGPSETLLRVRAIRALGALGQDEEVAALGELLKRRRLLARSEPEEVRRESALALVEIHRRTGSRSALDRLLEAVKSDPSEEVREAITKALERAGPLQESQGP